MITDYEAGRISAYAEWVAWGTSSVTAPTLSVDSITIRATATRVTAITGVDDLPPNNRASLRV